MTPGDPCRVCGGPEPSRTPLWKPTLVQVAAAFENVPRWRHTIGSTDEKPVRDWICFECLCRAVEYEGLILRPDLPWSIAFPLGATC